MQLISIKVILNLGIEGSLSTGQGSLAITLGREVREMKRVIKLKVNGEEREVYVEPWRTLAEVLRSHRGEGGL